MKRYVLDSHALIAYLEGEEEGKGMIPVLDNAVEGKAELYMCVVNWGEIYYITLRELGEEKAELYLSSISKYPITIVNVDRELTLVAARFKAHYKISYADAFAAGLAEIKNAVLLTGDEEFKQLNKIIKIKFL
jgi:ribonuclease VapC